MNLYSFLFFIILAIFSYDCNAQNANKFGHDRYSSAKSNKVDKSKFLEATLENLKAKLNLDGFQEAIVKNLIKETDEKAMQIFNNSNLEKKEKSDLLEKLASSFKNNVLNILSEEQKIIYEEF